MELQLRKFCQLHALNALFDRNIVQPQTMRDFCAEKIQRDTALGRTLRQQGYCPRDGNFPNNGSECLASLQLPANSQAQVHKGQYSS